MGQHVIVQRIKACLGHLGVVFPPDVVCHAGGFDDVFVLGRAAGKFAGGHQERATFAQGAFATGKRGFNQRRLDQVVIDIAQILDPLIFEPEIRVHPSRCHMSSPVAATGGSY